MQDRRNSNENNDSEPSNKEASSVAKSRNAIFAKGSAKLKIPGGAEVKIEGEINIPKPEGPKPEKPRCPIL